MSSYIYYNQKKDYNQYKTSHCIIAEHEREWRIPKSQPQPQPQYKP